MIRFTVLGCPFRVHILTPLFWALVAVMGAGDELPAVLMALCLHETAHIIAARLCGAGIEYIDIMPFGGAAHMSSIYAQRRRTLIIVALAGPAVNACLSMAGAALGWWGILSFPQAARIVRINTLLFLFNIMPALPLDGGRVLYALTCGALGRKMAVNIASLMGFILSAVLAVSAVVLAIDSGKLNITLIVMAVFLISSTLTERRAALENDASRTIDTLISERNYPAVMRLVALDKHMPARAAMRFLGGEATLFARIDGVAPISFMTEKQLAHLAMEETEGRTDARQA